MSNHIDIKRAVSQKRRVYFQFYRDGQLWYQTEFKELFPVQIQDLGSAAANSEEPAILYMRYMRKWNESNG